MMSFAVRVNRLAAVPPLPGPVQRNYLYPTISFTDIIPQGAKQVVIEAAGPGGGGGSSTIINAGAGGGGGGVGRSTFAIAPTQWGQTFVGTNGQGGNPGANGPHNGSPGGNTVVSNGTFTTPVTVTATGGGGGGYSQGGQAGTPGLAGNGYQNQVNIAGQNGSNLGMGGAGATGTYVSGGYGGNGGNNTGSGVSYATPGGSVLVYT